MICKFPASNGCSTLITDWLLYSWSRPALLTYLSVPRNHGERDSV